MSDFDAESEKNASGCFWKIVLIGGLIIGAYCYIREKMNDHYWEKEIAKSEERKKNPPPVSRQRPKTYHYHTCSVCGERYAEEGSFPNYATWCERCEKWHCGDCAANCIATKKLLESE